MSEFTERIAQFGDIEENVSFHKLTTLKVGGTARYVIYPNNEFCLESIIDICKDEGIRYKMFGNGSNILCSDDFYDGVIIKLSRYFNKVYYNDYEVTAQAGCSVINLAYEAMKKGMSGLEFASGIPGTLGGCVFMNAGAYKSSMSDIITEVQVYRNETTEWISVDECEFGYRTSVFQKEPWIITAVKMVLKPGKREEIEELMKDRQQRRFATQPLEYPSAGSVFRNPENGFSWQYIDKIGYRGMKYGDACVSQKHSNFIVNEGKATASDINRLINDIQSKVKENYDVDLILEVEKFNWK